MFTHYIPTYICMQHAPCCTYVIKYEHMLHAYVRTGKGVPMYCTVPVQANFSGISKELIAPTPPHAQKYDGRIPTD